MLGILFTAGIALVSASSKDIALKDLMVLSNSEGTSGIFNGGIVLKNGIKYRKFESKFGAILILDVANFTRRDVENAQCVPGMAPGKSVKSDTAIIQAEVSSGENGDWKAYAGLILETIKSKCDGTLPLAVGVSPTLDLGISRSIKNKDGVDTEVKVFNRNLGPNLNLDARF